MSGDARKRAERCFALARSTTFEGERKNAVAMGTRIAEEAGLSLDLFDIPGRARPEPMQPPPASRYREDLFKRGRSPFSDGQGWNPDDLRDVMARYRDQMAKAEAVARQQAAQQRADARAQEGLREARAEAMRRTGAQPDETPYDAQRRNFEAATADAKRRDDLKAKRAKVDEAVNDIWAAGYRIYRTADGLDGSRRWFGVLADGAGELTDDEVLQLSQIAKDRQAKA